MWKNVLVLVQFKSHHTIIVFLVAFMRHSLPKKTGNHNGVVVSMFDFHRSDRGSNPGRGSKIS